MCRGPTAFLNLKAETGRTGSLTSVTINHSRGTGYLE